MHVSACVHICVRACACTCVCPCVCVRERERDWYVCVYPLVHMHRSPHQPHPEEASTTHRYTPTTTHLLSKDNTYSVLTT